MNETSRPLIYDLHSHTTASDGLLSPRQLVERAVEYHIDVLAITDHDTVDGLDEARRAISELQLPLALINGVEVSTVWENHEIHIVGLGVDTANAGLRDFLGRQSASRRLRAEMIADRLEKARIPGALEGALRIADGGAITRGHFARYLVECGRATTIAGVFKNYLARGKTGYVPPQWCTIKQAIDVIHHSGGQAILAHPGRYRLSTKWLKRLLAYFAECGGDGMEVAQCQQAPNERNQLAQFARQYGLLASQGSDFHQPCPWIELGRNLRLPPDVTPVWQQWAPPVLIEESEA
ncbi:PHP domain-containing protein [Shimwellia pseudoproteus]|uniref:RNase RNM n=1 Tax=Shimwellia pseudoproteus TaxID=570012 RepID=UPI0018ED86D7|nr:PHP domain-containing protein [Shimwellia pseudoproteus]MBJ3815559.1 PHP domain-containing protein [Shimwellia pseudoproteus]